MDQRQTFDDFAEKFSESARPIIFQEDYWKSVGDLFTRDVTKKGMREFFEHETRDTVRFLTRDIDFSKLKPRPWFKKYPMMVWHIFLNVAHRMSPPRRLLFAIATPILAIAWLDYAFAFLGIILGDHNPRISFPPWFLISASLFFVLLVMELRDKLALKSDLEVARQIQFGLLPFEPYRKPDLAIDASMKPANTVGGDYFDIIELPDGKVAVVMGDVSGKAMPAALLMALLQGSLRTLITAGHRGIDLIEKLNAHLNANIPSNRLITLFYGEYDPATGVISYINAGHNPPYIIRSGNMVERLSSTGIALGVMPAVEFTAQDVQLQRCDRLFLFTDGITEAFNRREEEYGEVRLETLLRKDGHLPPKELLDALQEDVRTFCGSARQRDDMTTMIVTRLNEKNL